MGDSDHSIADFTQAIQLIGRVITSDPDMPSSLKRSASAGIAQILAWFLEARQTPPAQVTAKSPLDWVPPPAAAEWAPGTPENLAIVLNLAPGVSGRELEKAQFQVAVDMATLTALVGRDEASTVERRWEHRLREMYNSPYGDKELNRWGIDPTAIDRLVSEGKGPSALSIIRWFIGKREALLNEVTNRSVSRTEDNIKLRQFREDTRDIFSEDASHILISYNTKYLHMLERIISEGGELADHSRSGAKKGEAN